MKKVTFLLTTIFIFAAVGFHTTATSSVSAKAVSVVPQAKQEKPLAKAAADALVGELKEGLADLIEDEEAVAAIVKKWEARNLAGKTRKQILGVLFADVKSVVKEKETQDSIWEDWQEVGLEEEEAEEETPVETPKAPAPPPDPPAPQPKDYIGQMAENIAKLFDLQPATLKDLAIQFEKIGDAQKTEWLPYYYAALAHANAGWLESSLFNDRDANADKGKALLDKAEALSKGNSEIYIVRSTFATQQMMVDAQGRWMSYGMQANDALETAKKLNPNNPRVYLMQGQGVLSTPEQFGGGKAKAKPYFEEALRKFDVFKPESSISPNWGRKEALKFLNLSNQ